MQIDAYTYLSETRTPDGRLIAEARWTITVDAGTKIVDVVFYDGTTSQTVKIADHLDELNVMMKADGLMVDIQGRVFDIAQRDYVMQAMAYNGSQRIRVSDSKWAACYLLADGFGIIDRAFADEACWDWSHVRDSSPEGIARIAAYLKAVGI